VVPSESVRKQLSLGTEPVPQEKRQELVHTIVNSSMNIMHVDQTVGEAREGYNKKELQEVPRKKITYKKIIRVEGGKTSAKEGQELIKKRGFSEEISEVEGEGDNAGKISMEGVTNKRTKKAGLVDQSCKNQ
jgi:hypothetical protein